MVTYDDFILTCQDLAQAPDSASEAFFLRVGNTGYRRAMKMFGRSFEERTQTASTATDQQFYQLPPDYSFAVSVSVTVGSLLYPLEEIESQEEWDNLNRLTTVSNNIPTRYFIRQNIGIAGDEIGIWPRPSSSGNTITLVYEAIPKNLGQAKYTAGTVSVTQNSATITGSGTTWVSTMVGRYVNLTDANSDGNFYRVSLVDSTTSITLENVYEGSTVSGASYRICELFALPEEAQMVPVYYALWHWYLMKQNAPQAGVYKALYDQEFNEAKRLNAQKSRNAIVKRGTTVNLNTPYPLHFPTSIT